VDRAIRASTGVVVLTVAGIAAYISCWHTNAVVREYGESGVTALLEPATIDGLVYASSMVILYSARHRLPVPLDARARHRRLPRRERGTGLVPRSGRRGGDGVTRGGTRGDGHRLRQLRGVLPCEVRVVGGHPLAGSTLMASWFNGVVFTGAASVAVTRYRYRYRGSTIPIPWTPAPAPG
jgi:hypothetical protein